MKKEEAKTAQGEKEQWDEMKQKWEDLEWEQARIELWRQNLKSATWQWLPVKKLYSSVRRSIDASSAARCAGEEDEAAIREDGEQKRLMKCASKASEDEGRSSSAEPLLESL